MNEKMKYQGDLILVNASHKLQYENKDNLVQIDAEYPSILVDKKMKNAYESIMQEIDGFKKIVPVSGYRSHTEQTLLFEESLKENGKEFTYKYVALPDASEHQTGLALDVGIQLDEIDFIRPEFPYTGIAQKFREIAPKYGLIERYSLEKEKITGISHEPWHFRYVGIPHAELIKEHSLCLEEYISFLKKYTYPEYLEYKGYHIFYTQDGFFLSNTASVSGNNIDGYIVTLKK